MPWDPSKGPTKSLGPSVRAEVLLGLCGYVPGFLTGGEGKSFLDCFSGTPLDHLIAATSSKKGPFRLVVYRAATPKSNMTVSFWNLSNSMRLFGARRLGA